MTNETNDRPVRTADEAWTAYQTTRTDLAAKSAQAARVLRRLEDWHGHILSPATRKADRQKTYEAIMRTMVDAVLQDWGPEADAARKSLLAVHGIAP